MSNKFEIELKNDLLKSMVVIFLGFFLLNYRQKEYPLF